MGSISNVLPLNWLNVTGNLNSNKLAVLNFKVNENNVVKYEIKKSNDAKNFTSIATINSKGNGENNYQFTDAASLVGIIFYRTKQIDNDSRFSYSSVIELSANADKIINIYPNPAKHMVTVSGATVGSKICLVDAVGKILQQIMVTQYFFYVDVSKYNRGIYLLKTDNGVTQKIIKE